MNAPPILRRLTKRAQFLAVRQGARAARSHVLIEARRREEAGPIGVGFRQQVGGAVARNRAKRRLREAARQLLPTRATLRGLRPGRAAIDPRGGLGGLA